MVYTVLAILHLMDSWDHLWLTVVLQGHSDDINADYEGDYKVQVVAGAQCMDGQADSAIGSIVWQLLGLWAEKG